MNRSGLLALLAAAVLFGAASLHAQWKTETYVLRAGWNGLYLQGDASYATPAELFAAYPAVTMIGAALFLSESITPAKVGGMLLVLAGVVVLTVAD